jgi:hypothetical protein
MQFPFVQVGAGIFRPIVSVLAWGPFGSLPMDGLLDSGSDRTLLPAKLVRSLGIDVDALPTPIAVRSATGQRVVCKTTHLIFDLRRGGSRFCWVADVAVATQVTFQRPHRGFKGFLEYFLTEFDGPNRIVTLFPGANLPVTNPP